jgi:DHA1 family inner membrane transport protein
MTLRRRVVSSGTSSGWFVPVLALCIATIAVSTSELVVTGLLPTIAGDLSVDIPTAGLLIAGYAMAVAVAGPILSIATGRLPRRTLLLASMAVFVIGNVLCAIAPSYGLLLAARLLVACIHGLYFSIAMVIATRLAPPDRQASAVSLVIAGFTIANTIGVPLGTAIGEALGWRWVFWAIAGLAIVMIGVVAWLVPASAQGSEPQSDWRADLGAVLRPAVLLCYGSIALFMMGVIAFFAYSVPFITTTSGVPAAMVPWVLFGAGVASFVSNIVGGRLGDWRPVPTMIGALCLAALLYFGLQAWATQTWVAVGLFWALWLVGFGFVGPVQARILADTKDAPNLASALISTAFNAGIAIGAALGGSAIAAGWSYARLPWISVIFMGLALVAVTLLLLSGRRVPAAA